MYGTTNFGGANGVGIVYHLSTTDSLTTLYTFDGYGYCNTNSSETCGTSSSTDGADPRGGLILGADGVMFGTTSEGGAWRSGTFYSVTPGGVETVLYSFCGAWNGIICADGSYPYAGLIQARDGNFYGTTEYGGAHDGGELFEITSAGAETVLYSFSGGPYGLSGSTDGGVPYAPPIQGSDGDFYGTTSAGGTAGVGTLYKVSPAGAETVLYSFGNGGIWDGGGPNGALVQGGDGNFYGTTVYGGLYGRGTVFKVTPAGVESTLHSFIYPDGICPCAGLIEGSDGNLYGTTSQGDQNFTGTIFKVTPTGVETVLYTFAGSPDGSKPFSSLTQGSDGNFYGTTYSGGSNGGQGAMFKLTNVILPQ